MSDYTKHTVWHTLPDLAGELFNIYHVRRYDATFVDLATLVNIQLKDQVSQSPIALTASYNTVVQHVLARGEMAVKALSYRVREAINYEEPFLNQ